jgi:hypothetical protein
VAKHKGAAPKPQSPKPQSPKPQSPKPQSFADLQRQISEEGRRYERLRQPLPPEAVARLKAPERAQHIVAARNLRRAERQWHEWQEHAREARGPGWRKDPDLALSAQHWREHLAQLCGTLDYYLRARAAQQAPTKPRLPEHKHAGGNPQILTDEEIVRLRDAYDEARAKGKRKQADVFKDLRLLLPKRKRSISDRQLRHHIVTTRNN